MALTERDAEQPTVGEPARVWNEEEFAAFRTSMTAMLREARKMGLSDWELRPVREGGTPRGLAQRIHRLRAARAELFGHADLFGEPAWDMLLGLFLAHEQGRPASIGEVYRAAHVAADVGSQLLAQLERREMVERLSGLPESVRLTPATVAAMIRFLDDGAGL